MRDEIQDALNRANAARPPRPKGMRGRPKGSKDKGYRLGRPVGKATWNAREIAELCGMEPISLMCKVILTGRLPPIMVPSPDGTTTVTQECIISTEDRMKTLRDVTRYLYPAISSVQLTGKDGGPINIAALDVTQLMSDPALAAMAQTLSLAATEQLMLNGSEEYEDVDAIDAETEDPKE